MTSIFILLLALSLAVAAPTAAAAAAAAKQVETCLAQGFNSGALACSTCDVVNTVTGDLDLTDECQRCCDPLLDQATGAAEEKYSSAVLEVDKRFLSAFANVEDMVARTKKKENGLDVGIKVRSRFGVRPQLVLYRGSVIAETIPITGWSVDDLKDFVKASIVLDA